MFFFFKQKTAYEMRISDWSSDVCSSDLTVGGRYSLWSAIGFPAALGLGREAFERLLEGAAAMDRHFRYAPPERNAPLIAAFADLYYARVRGAETRAVFAYDERLSLLPSYLQQLEMESRSEEHTSELQSLMR